MLAITRMFVQRSFLIFFYLFFTSSAFGQIGGVVNIYRKVLFVDTARGMLKLANAGNLIPYSGSGVMVIQMKGATIDESNTASFGNITAINNAGRFEIGKLCGQIGDSIVLENKLQNYYDVAGLVQIVIIPKYVNVNVSGNLYAAPWDPVADTGGVVAIEASGTITLNASISADSAGFRGGGLHNETLPCSNSFPASAYYYSISPAFGGGGKKGEGIAEYISGKEFGKGKQSNGGGGGNNANNGGGGGSNYSSGGLGGNKTTGCNAANPGLGGSPLSTFGYSALNFRIFLGGGGGAGDENDFFGTAGGHGGGLVYIKAATLTNVSGKITSNGSIGINAGLPNDPYSSASDGAGGGGAGGTVILQVNNFANNLNVAVRGGRGSNSEGGGGSSNCAGPGGGGAGGFVWLSNATIPANVLIDNSGGVKGVILSGACIGSSNGATNGSNGSSSGGFAFPALKDTSPVCKQILPINLIRDFSNNLAGDKINFTLTLNDRYQALKLILQGSMDGNTFFDLTQQYGTGSLQYHFEEFRSSILFYRVEIIKGNGGTEYSKVLILRQRASKTALGIYPNPAFSTLEINVDIPVNQEGIINIYDISGRMVYKSLLSLQAGTRNYNISLESLPPGLYLLQLISPGVNGRRSFLHY